MAVETICPLGCGPLVPDGTSYRDNRMGLPHTVHIGWCPVCGLGVTLDAPEDLGSCTRASTGAKKGAYRPPGDWHTRGTSSTEACP